jgi:hypothetical protein
MCIFRRLILGQKNGWVGRIRTPGWQGQNLLPYRLATTQQKKGDPINKNNLLFRL